MQRPPAEFDPSNPTADDLLWAYRHGVFPMADPLTNSIDWYCPDPRGVLPLNAFHVPKNLAREVRQARFTIRSDTAFKQVMRECSKPRRDPENLSWISEHLISVYTELHERGHAHSVEAWLVNDADEKSRQSEQLVGGLYGVHIGGAFFGESMFSRPEIGGTNASKICLVHLVERLRHQGFALLDTQFRNEHLAQFGCIEIPAVEYLNRLQDAVQMDVQWWGTD